MKHPAVYHKGRVAGVVNQELGVAGQQLGQFLLQVGNGKRHAMLIANKKHFLGSLIHDNRPNWLTGSIDFLPFAR